jgi:large subunit ribosomal protein L35
MPKQKTNSSAKKRFKVTGTGKLLRRHAMKSHNLEKKSAKRKRSFRADQALSGSDAREVRRLLGR